MIFRFVRTSKVIEWIKNNYPTSLNGTAGDSWKHFLSNHGGTGSTFHDLEQSYIANNNRTIHDRWSSFVGGVGSFLDRIRAYFESVAEPPTEETILPYFFFIIPK